MRLSLLLLFAGCAPVTTEPTSLDEDTPTIAPAPVEYRRFIDVQGEPAAVSEHLFVSSRESALRIQAHEDGALSAEVELESRVARSGQAATDACARATSPRKSATSLSLARSRERTLAIACSRAAIQLLKSTG